jgi:cell division protein FtsQ
MWDNPRRLNMVAGALVGVATLAFTAAAVWGLLHSSLFPVREAELATPLRHTSRAQVEAALRAGVRGNFFAASPTEVRAALEALPWVRRASVRRVWPDRLVLALEEHEALASWADEALVNRHGELFAGRPQEKLPLFVGPSGTERELTLRYARFSEAVAPLGARVERVVLTARYAWQLRLEGGLDIMLGRDAEAAEQRLRRFVAVYPHAVHAAAGKHDYVDLRYPNGFALRVPAGSQAGGG